MNNPDIINNQKRNLNNDAKLSTDKQALAPTPAQGTPVASGELDDLLSLMARLRADCPWDKKQTNHSLIPYAIEEAYELGEAVQSDDDEDIKSELGDVLLQVVFHCQMYAEQGRFDMSDVMTTLQEKLIRRHPHVFEAETLKDDAAVKQRWDEIKAEEDRARAARGKPKRRLDSIKAGSALMQAQEVQKQASKLGFDWEGVSGAFDKLDEEVAELKSELIGKSNIKIKANMSDIEKELGDCMFALVNVARKLNLDAETATLTCLHKFKSRFGYIEDQLAAAGKRVEDSNIDEMDTLWDAAKQHERD
ncbi:MULTISPECIES: nucleoside triphosphate pyrophosphohydrolase [unclassified Psychrobacter]|uniref:nucleoside triphosphate pyrophosphohydrolase n=1 Tax=unclassified Psychrobacter TaxID=196806 RepID=UPI0028A7F1AE|nr:nucleoside triphosphate pyrophosphohydrolase [Psychrobacter sp.]